MEDEIKVPAAVTKQIAALWQKNKPLLRERLALLDRAATELTETRSLDEELRAEAISTAHKLAGSLGMFGHGGATEFARSIEADLEASGLPQPERLRQHVDKLQATLAKALQD